MIPDDNMIKAVLVRMEQDINKRGWDQPARLWALTAIDDGLRASPVPLPDGSPGETLERAAAGFTATSAGRAVVAALARREFAGFVFISESWANYEMTPEQYARESRRLADIPGSVESRDVSCVDTGGRLLGLHRKRGKEPVNNWETTDGNFSGLGGRIIDALLVMVRAIAEKMPAGTADLETLRNAKAFSEQQAQQLIDERRAMRKSED